MPYALLAGLLAALSTVGPFAIDTYLPALPAIGREFGASPAQVQFVVESHTGQRRRKGTAADLLAMAGMSRR